MKKILPPTLFLFMAFLMIVLYFTFDFKANILYPYNLILGVPFLILGLVISFYHSKLFEKEDINIMTFEEPSVICKKAMFKYTRNPMYLGFASSLFALAIVLKASFIFLFIAFLFCMITNYWYIRFEEKYMLEKFGIQYEKYCKEVRRWI